MKREEAIPHEGDEQDTQSRAQLEYMNEEGMQDEVKPMSDQLGLHLR